MTPEEFRREVTQDAQEFLAGRMNANDFASSVSYNAGSLAIETSDGQIDDEWAKFADWSDELDQVLLGERPQNDEARIHEEIRAAALDLLDHFPNLS